MAVQGEVVGAAWMPLGSEATEAAPAGALSVIVENPVDFDDDGGIVDVDGVALEFDTIDEDTGVLTLDEPLPASVEEGQWIGLRVGGGVASDLILYVSLGDGDEIEIPAGYAERDRWPEGEYDQPVPVIVSDDLEAVLDVPGRIPVVDGSFIDPGTLPESGGPSEPPESSPALTVAGTVNGLVVRAEEVAPSTRIAYHITADPPRDAEGEPLEFTPTPQTMIGEPTRSTVIVVTELPGEGEDLALDATYYLRAVASNDLGEAPPGPQAQGHLDTSNIADVVAESMTAGFVLAGSIQVGQITIDPDSGITIPTGDGGLIQLPADGSEATITGALRTNDVIVENNLVVNGETNAIAGTLGLANVVAAPKGPPQVGWQFEHLTTIASSGGSLRGLTDSYDGERWLTLELAAGTVHAFRKSDGAYVGNEVGRVNGYPQAVTRVGRHFYILSRNAKGAIQVIKRTADTNEFVDTTGFFLAGGNIDGWYTGIGTDAAGNILVASPPTSANNWTRLTSIAPNLTFNGATRLHGHKVAQPRSVGRGPVGPNGEVYTWVTDGYAMHVYNQDRNHIGEYWGGRRNAFLADDGAIVYMDTTGRGIYRIDTSQHWLTTPEIGFTWYDSDPGGTGTHETDLSPTVRYRPRPGSRLVVTTPPPPDKGQPDDPDSVRIYLDGHRQPDLGVGVTTARYADLDLTGPPPPVENEFAGAVANPGVIRSDAADADGPLIELSGSGAGRAGPLRWDALGRQIGDQPQAGVVTTAPISGGGSWEVVATVTFDRPFTSPPSIAITNSSAFGGSDPIFWSHAIYNEEGFTLRARCNSSKNGQIVHWQAFGVTQ